MEYKRRTAASLVATFMCALCVKQQAFRYREPIDYVGLIKATGGLMLMANYTQFYKE